MKIQLSPHSNENVSLYRYVHIHILSFLFGKCVSGLLSAFEIIACLLLASGWCFNGWFTITITPRTFNVTLILIF